MNVYDFDKTICSRDSSYRFYFYCLRKNPLIALWWPVQAWGLFLLVLRLRSKTRCKELFYRFFRSMGDTEAVARQFWQENEGLIQPWYLAQKRPEDVIISASPEFLLRPICEKLGVRLIASRVDPKTGLTSGENCHDIEKVRRFREEYPGVTPEGFWSDSLSDTPMAELAREGWLVSGDRIRPWEKERTP